MSECNVCVVCGVDNSGDGEDVHLREFRGKCICQDCYNSIESKEEGNGLDTLLG